MRKHRESMVSFYDTIELCTRICTSTPHIHLKSAERAHPRASTRSLCVKRPHLKDHRGLSQGNLTKVRLFESNAVPRCTTIEKSLVRSTIILALLSLCVLSDPFALNYNAYCANPLMLRPGTIRCIHHMSRGDVCAYYALSSLVSAA